MRTLSLSRARPATHPALWLLLAGHAMAAIDLGLAASYWAPRGLYPERLLQAFAGWLLGAQAYHGGAATALLGALVYGLVLSGALGLLHLLASRVDAFDRHPLPFGAAYGVAAYFAIFHVLAPALTGRPASLAHPDWIAACLLVFVLVIGIPGALLSQALRGRAHARP